MKHTKEHREPLVRRSATLLITMGLLFGMHAGAAECADWLKLTENEEGVFYADRDTLSKGAGQVKEARELSVLKNHKEIVRMLEVVEYDCSEKKRRVIQVLTQTKNGEAVLASTLNAAWGPVMQHQTATVFFEAACKK